MCFPRPPKPPEPAPLPPAPTPPPPPPAPIPPPDDVKVQEVNPSVRRAKTKKSKGEYGRGADQLRVPVAKPKVNVGQAGPAGGINK